MNLTIHPEINIIQQEFLKRVLKEAVHEMGHTFGIPHCENHLCVMHFSNSIVETGIKGAGFCRNCLNELKNMYRDLKRS
jgi:archaemetzincin